MYAEDHQLYNAQNDPEQAVINNVGAQACRWYNKNFFQENLRKYQPMVISNDTSWQYD